MLQQLKDAAMGPALFTGLAGAFWTLRHFAGSEAITRQLDGYDNILLPNGLPHAPLDMITGLSGTAIYAATSEESQLSKACAFELAKVLNRAIRPGDDLGISHGVAGTLLASITMMRRKSAYIPDQFCAALRRACEDYCSVIEEQSFVVGYNANDGKFGRLAWCYGPLCSALVLAGAGVQFSVERFTSAAMEIMRRIEGRERHLWGIEDYGLCHGIAGVALMLSEIERLTGGSFSSTELAINEATDTAVGILQSQISSLGPDRSYGEFSLLGGQWGLLLWWIMQRFPEASADWKALFVGDM
ncbi:Lanthionine synthetase C-like protein [Stenotrophomonas sp. CC120222-04]|nr:Lanthionine synthetase C-like protein [Stenotrophomonas sp. CC120222-04]